MEKPANKLSPDLQRWIADASPELQRTVVVHLTHSQDVGAAVKSLESVGFEVQSAGKSVVTGISHAKGLSEIAKFPWVVALSTPQRLETKL